MSMLRKLLTEESISIGSVVKELERGSDPNTVSRDEGVSAMHLAAGLGKEITGCFLQYGGDPNVRSREGITPLHVAASYGDLETLTLLLCNGANANVQDEDGNRPFDLAIENGHQHCIDELKFHTMLASVEDCSGEQYLSRNPEEYNSFQGHQRYFENSFIDPEVLKHNYAKAVTQEVYDYLSEGKKICFDVTSPTTPLVGLKKSYCKTCCSCDADNKSCSMHRSLNTSRQNSYLPETEQYILNSSTHPSSLICHHCSIFTSHSPQRPAGSIPSSPVRRNQASSCLNCSSQRLHHHSSHFHHSPAQENSDMQHVLPSSLGSNRPLYSQQQLYSTSPLRANCSSPLSSRSPQRRIHETQHSVPLLNGRWSPATNEAFAYMFSPYHDKIDHSVSPQLSRNIIHSPKRQNQFFPSLYPNSSSNQNDCTTQTRQFFDESGNCSAMTPTSSCNQRYACPKMKDKTLSGLLESGCNGESTDDKYLAHQYNGSSNSSDKSVSSTLSRVAEYVLSCTDFSSQCNVDDSSKTVANPSHAVSKSQSMENENLVPRDTVSKNDSTSSSTDSFCTAENESSPNSPNNTVNTEHSHSNIPIDKSPHVGDSECSSSFMKDSHCSQKTLSLSQRWQAPTLTFTNFLDDTIMTSETSSTPTLEDNISIPQFRDTIFKSNKNSVNQEVPKMTEFQRKKMELGVPNIYGIKKNEARGLDDSLFSTITVEEFVHTDPESGITLVEKWIPSECGSSRASIVSSRRSLESLNSKLSQDSQATLIYDWKTLKEVSKLDGGNDLDHGDPLQIYDNQTVEDDVDDSKIEHTVIPLHLKKMSNEQLSQELQRFGEIPGPVIAATRQVYLRRLASLESEPCLVKITKGCPDYPNDLRKAMEGRFDWSEMADLEMKMVENFSNTQGRQWREGCVKSSFTYLLLDPRVTSNLPLRVKDLSEVELFKNFICAIFYIGKGKRARPYCHLYEAVSKMNHDNCKKSDKVKHILDVWNNNLGVISLHCFQSVIPVEAYTREACMLEAIGMHKVTNVKRGDFYGVVSTWPAQQKRKLGVYLLHKAMKIFLIEGERQISPPDLKSRAQ